MSSEIKVNCRNCDEVNGLKLKEVFEDINFACYSCKAYAIPRELIKSSLIWGAFSLIWLCFYCFLEYSWYKKASTQFQQAMKNLGSSAVFSAKKSSPQFYKFNPIEYGSYSVGEKLSELDAKNKILLSLKSPRQFDEWVEELEQKGKFTFWKNGCIYPSFLILIFLLINYDKHKLFSFSLLDRVSGEYGWLVNASIILNLAHMTAGVYAFCYWVLYLEFPFLGLN